MVNFYLKTILGLRKMALRTEQESCFGLMEQSMKASLPWISKMAMEGKSSPMANTMSATLPMIKPTGSELFKISMVGNTKATGEMTSNMVSERRFGTMELKHMKAISLKARKTARASFLGAMALTTKATLLMDFSRVLVHTISRKVRRHTMDSSMMAKLMVRVK